MATNDSPPLVFDVAAAVLGTGQASSPPTSLSLQPAPVLPSAVVVPPLSSLQSANHFVSLKLTTENYLYWRTQMILFLRGQNLLGYVDGTLPCPSPFIAAAESSPALPNPDYSVWIKQDQSILSMLISSLSKETMRLALGKTTSRMLWLSIETHLGAATRARMLGLYSQLQCLQQGDSTPTEYLTRAQTIIEQLAMAGREISLDEQNLFILRGLRLEYSAMASSLVTKGTPVTIEQLDGYLNAQQFLCSDQFLAPNNHPGLLPTPPHAMVARTGGGQHGQQNRQSTNRSSGGWRGRQQPGGRQSGGNWRGGGGRGRGARNSDPKCQICFNFGHTVASYYQRFVNPHQANIMYSEPVNQAQFPPQDNMTYSDQLGSAPFAQNWFVETGAMTHATLDSTSLTEVQEYHGPDGFRIGNGLQNQGTTPQG